MRRTPRAAQLTLRAVTRRHAVPARRRASLSLTIQRRPRRRAVMSFLTPGAPRAISVPARTLTVPEAGALVSAGGAWSGGVPVVVPPAGGSPAGWSSPGGGLSPGGGPPPPGGGVGRASAAE